MPRADRSLINARSRVSLQIFLRRIDSLSIVSSLLRSQMWGDDYRVAYEAWIISLRPFLSMYYRLTLISIYNLFFIFFLFLELANNTVKFVMFF